MAVTFAKLQQWQDKKKVVNLQNWSSDYGRRRRGAGGHGSPWIFIHGTDI